MSLREEWTRVLREVYLKEKTIPYDNRIHRKSGNAIYKKGTEIKIGSFSKDETGKSVVKLSGDQSDKDSGTEPEPKADQPKTKPDKKVATKIKDTPKKEPTSTGDDQKKSSPISPETKTLLRTKDHETADRQLDFDSVQMKQEVEVLKNIEKYATDISEYSFDSIKNKLKPPSGVNVILPSEDEIRKFMESGDIKGLEKKYNGKTKDGNFYPSLKSIAKAVNTYRVDNNLPSGGVGAGTADSRAGEVATHKALRMLKDGSSLEDVETLLKSKVGKGKPLTNSWVSASLACCKSIIDTVGLDNIEEVVWDTPSGRELINTEGHGTSSDMFVTTKSGERVGISLKKDGDVFLANKGYNIEFEKLKSSLERAGLSQKDIKEFSKSCSAERFNSELIKTTNSVISSLNSNKNNKNEILEILDHSTDAKKELLRKRFGQKTWSGVEKYLKEIAPNKQGETVSMADLDAFLKKVGGSTGTGSAVKTFAKILKSMDNKDYYNSMREEDTKATQRLLKSMENENVAKGIKNNIIEGMHAESILGLDNNPHLDKFMTVYGIEPDGAQMDENTLASLFPELGGPKGLMEMSEQFRGARGINDKEAIKKQIMEAMRNKMEIVQNGPEATINVVHKDSSGKVSGKYPIFTTRVRCRGVGTAPVLEIHQTSFFSTALSKAESGEQLGVDMSKWPEKKRNNFYKKEIVRLKKELEEGGDDMPDSEKEDINNQIKMYEKEMGLKENYQSLESVIARMYQRR